MEGTKKIKSRLFRQYSWNSEVETTWISLIGWPHKTSSTYLCLNFLYSFQVMKVVEDVFPLCLQIGLPEAQSVQQALHQDCQLSVKEVGFKWEFLLRNRAWLSVFGLQKDWKWWRPTSQWPCQNPMHLQDSPFMGKKRTRIIEIFRWSKFIKQ